MATPTHRVSLDWRLMLLLGFVLGSLGWALFAAPIPQDLAYHRFVDTRSLLGVPNFLNVVSNLLFLIVGVMGMRVAFAMPACSSRLCWILFFVGVALVSLGSGYYHLTPNSVTLVWDRLPMTVGFMALFVALLSEYLDARIARWLLLPALLVGAASVFYWHLTDDLRFYAWVQFMPLGVILILLGAYRAPYIPISYLVAALVGYLLAKLAEYFDGPIYQALGGTISGHSLKHLFAGVACGFLALWLARRARQAGAPPV